MEKKIRLLFTLSMIAMPFVLGFVVRIPLTIATSPKTISNTTIELLNKFKTDIESLPDEAFDHSVIAEQYKNALSNKVKAVINQVEAGTLQGAMEKLNNDILDKIQKWIVEPWRTTLTEKLNEIIDLIGLYL